jgi:hypothetical protein
VLRRLPALKVLKLRVMGDVQQQVKPAVAALMQGSGVEML